MTDFVIALLQEAKGQPLATILVLLIVIACIVLAILLVPKLVRNRRTLTAQIAQSNELIRHNSAVIENNSRCMDNNTKFMEISKQSMDNICQKVSDLRDQFEKHDDHALSVLNKQTEILAIIQNK